MSFVDVGTHPSRVLRERGVALPYEGGAGLGAFTRNGFTVRYYANPGQLSFSNANLRKLYEGMRNADIDFQKLCRDVLRAISPVFGALEFGSGGKLNARDMRTALQLRLPTWGVALFLEVAAGRRALDDAFKSFMRQVADDMAASTALFGTLLGINATCLVLAAIPATAPVFATILPITIPLAGLAAAGTSLAATLRPIFDTIARGTPPSAAQVKTMTTGAANISGQKPPSDAEVQFLTSTFGQAMRAPPDRSALDAAKAAMPSPTSTTAFSSTLTRFASRLPSPTSTTTFSPASAPSSSGDFPWLLAGGAALVGIGGLALAMRRRRR